MMGAVCAYHVCEISVYDLDRLPPFSLTLISCFLFPSNTAHYFLSLVREQTDTLHIFFRINSFSSYREFLLTANLGPRVEYVLCQCAIIKFIYW